MAFARLFPIDAADAQDDDRTSFEIKFFGWHVLRLPRTDQITAATCPVRRAQTRRRRRHQPRRPPLANKRPGKPAPTIGPGTGGVPKKILARSLVMPPLCMSQQDCSEKPFASRPSNGTKPPVALVEGVNWEKTGWPLNWPPLTVAVNVTWKFPTCAYHCGPPPETHPPTCPQVGSGIMWLVPMYWSS